MKKLTSIILSVGLILNIFCTLGITVSADNTNVEVNSEGDTSSYVLKYNELSDGTLEVCGFENNTSEVDLIIPSEHNGKRITRIADSAFKSNWNITSLTVSETVDSIGAYAFENCRNLNRVVMGKGITNIGLWAFKDCTGLKGVYISDLKSWNNIKFFDAEANPLNCAGNLYLNEKLVTDLIIPNDVTSINCSAFQECTSITSVTIPNGVKSICSHAFSECKKLTDVAISKSVTSIGDAAFWGCTNLENIYYSGDKSDWKKIQIGEINAVITESTIHYNSYDGGTTGDYTWISTEPIAEPTEPIAEPTEPIAEPTEPIAEPTEPIAEPTEPIAEPTEPIAEPTEPVAEPTEPIVEPTEPIAEQPTEPLAPPPEWRYRELSDNTVEAYLYIPPYSYGEFYPSDNPYEDYDTIPSSYKGKPVTRIGNAVNGGYYYGCSIVLDFITIPENVTHIESGAFPVFHNVRTIYFNAADCKQAGSLSIQNGSNTVKSAFEELTSAEKIVFGDKVKTIPDFAFGGLINLKDITIPESVTSIGKYAFYGCTGLTSITLPASITSIGKNAFDGCTNLSIAYVSEETSFDSKSTFPSQTVVKILKFFTIHYNANGGNGIPEDQIKKTGDTINLSVMVPTRKYHTFVGWTEHLCSDKYYQPGSAFTEDRNITLFAVWGMDCYYCNGKGKTNEEVTCKYCKGKGSVNATVKCSTCEGSGQIIANVVHFRCEVCNGTGFYGGNNCFRCKGLGYYTQRELATCPKCLGTGKVNESRECRYCWGDGYRFEDIICTECEGKGKIIEKADHKCEWVVTKPATKTQTGIKENRCVVCGAVVESKIIPKITKFILGDVDGDSNIEVRDATWIQRHIAEVEMPFVINKTTADVDGDGIITVMDATAIQYYLANMKISYKIGEKIE